MRRSLVLLIAGSVPASAIEGTVWYDSKGQVAWVDGPAAVKKSPAPFIPQWVAREERRDHALRGDYRPRGNASCDWPVWGYWTGVRPHFRGVGGLLHCRTYPSSSFYSSRSAGGVRVIIR